jgi:hypothetical protein
MGDNANVYRLVENNANPAPGALPSPDPLAGYAPDTFHEFNYDQTTQYEDRGAERIVVRAMEQLDYVRGGSDYAW